MLGVYSGVGVGLFLYSYKWQSAVHFHDRRECFINPNQHPRTRHQLNFFILRKIK